MKKAFSDIAEGFLDVILFYADRVFFIGGKGKMQESWLLAHFG